MDNLKENIKATVTCEHSRVADPDPYVFGPPGSGPVSQRYGSGSFYNQAKIVTKTLIPTVLKNYVTKSQIRNTECKNHLLLISHIINGRSKSASKKNKGLYPRQSFWKLADIGIAIS